MHPEESRPISHPSLSRENQNECLQVQVLVAGSRLLASCLADTIRGFEEVEGLGIEAQYLDKHRDIAQLEQLEQKQSTRTAGISTVLILVLVCCGTEDVPSLLASPAVSSFLSSGGNQTRIVLVCSKVGQAEMCSPRFRKNIRVLLSLDASIEELREAVIAASLPLPETFKASSKRLAKEKKLQAMTPLSSPSINRKGGERRSVGSPHFPESVQQTCPPYEPYQPYQPVRGSLRYPYRHLTACEEQTARLAAEGFSNTEIAERLCTSVATVKSHLQKTFRKTELRRRSQLATLFTTPVFSALAAHYPNADDDFTGQPTGSKI